MLAILDLAKAPKTHKATANETTCEVCHVNAVAFRDPAACMSLCPHCAASRPTLCTLLPLVTVPAAKATPQVAALPGMAPLGLQVTDAQKADETAIEALDAIKAQIKAKAISHTDSRGNTLVIHPPAPAIVAAAHKVANTPAATFQLHFAGPQGRGVGDRLKAAGGKWIKENWRLPDTAATRALVAALQVEGRPVSIIA